MNRTVMSPHACDGVSCPRVLPPPSSYSSTPSACAVPALLFCSSTVRWCAPARVGASLPALGPWTAPDGGPSGRPATRPARHGQGNDRQRLCCRRGRPGAAARGCEERISTEGTSPHALACRPTRLRGRGCPSLALRGCLCSLLSGLCPLVTLPSSLTLLPCCRPLGAPPLDAHLCACVT